jgi:hypothetical protein
MKIRIVTLISACSCVLAANPCARAGTISDGFEGQTLSSLWAANGPGTEVLTTATAYAGSQSALLTVSTTFPWNADLTHDFGSEQYGAVSVYAQSGIVCCGSAAVFQIGNNPGVGDIADIQRTSLGTYVVRITPGPNETDFSIGTSALTWNQLEITDNPNTGLSIIFNGSTVFTDSAVTTPFRYVDLSEYGGSGGSEYFDNFAATTSNAVPEPSTLWMLAAVGALSVAWRPRNRH